VYEVILLNWHYTGTRFWIEALSRKIQLHSLNFQEDVAQMYVASDLQMKELPSKPSKSILMPFSIPVAFFLDTVWLVIALQFYQRSVGS